MKSDKVTDEVWATVKTKRQSKVDLASITGTYQDKWFEMLL
jgi:hypothetical protein